MLACNQSLANERSQKLADALLSFFRQFDQCGCPIRGQKQADFDDVLHAESCAADDRAESWLTVLQGGRIAGEDMSLPRGMHSNV